MHTISVELATASSSAKEKNPLFETEEKPPLAARATSSAMLATAQDWKL